MHCVVGPGELRIRREVRVELMRRALSARRVTFPQQHPDTSSVKITTNYSSWGLVRRNTSPSGSAPLANNNTNQ